MRSDDSHGDDEDGPLDDEEDQQTDEMEFESTKGSSDADLGEETEDECTKLIQSMARVW